MEPDHIHIKGAREHNLKNVSLKIPKKKLVVMMLTSAPVANHAASRPLCASSRVSAARMLKSVGSNACSGLDAPSRTLGSVSGS